MQGLRNCLSYAIQFYSHIKGNNDEKQNANDSKAPSVKVEAEDFISSNISIETLVVDDNKTITRTEADETEEVFRVRTTMKNILNKLPGNFLRINSKDIINTDSVNHFENDSVILKTAIRLPISKNYRQEFAERMGRAYHCKMTHTKVYVIHGT